MVVCVGRRKDCIVSVFFSNLKASSPNKILLYYYVYHSVAMNIFCWYVCLCGDLLLLCISFRVANGALGIISRSAAQDDVQPIRFFFASARAADVVFDAQMASVQALLSAAGLDKPNTKLLKKSTATEHATSSFQSDPATTSNATEHAVSRLPLTWIQMFTY